MKFYDFLVAETRPAREKFLANPEIRRALAGDITKHTYGAFLAQAYHHVKFTCPLLALAASRCGERDRRFFDALRVYMAEERGHDIWILEDIAALGLPARPLPPANAACRAMIGYAHYAIEHESPYAMLGMVHVLEGMSVALATQAAGAIAAALGRPDGGFRYLTSHGDIDREHVAMFRDLVNGIDDGAAQSAIIATAEIVYKLYGDMFTAVGETGREADTHVVA